MYLRHDPSVRRFLAWKIGPLSFLFGFFLTVEFSTAAAKHREGRGAWVLTAYGISGLALFGVLAYFFSDFIAH